MRDRNYFPFYYSWANLINKYSDKGDDETAKQLALAIILYAARNKITGPNNQQLLQILKTIQKGRGYNDDTNEN